MRLPESVANYRVLDRIGTGGLGDLYRARDNLSGRTVALRVLPAPVGNAEYLNSVLRSARSVAALSHPNIAALFDVGEDGLTPYLAFEFVPGELLSDMLRRQPLEARRAVDFAIQIADALAEAEGHEIVHGDIRPETIIITPKGRPKVIHFGLTAFTTGGAARALETPGSSPRDGLSGRQDPGMDIRALGLVLEEMLTGRLAVRARPEADPARPYTSNTGGPPELDAVVRKSLSTDPDERYQTAATVAAELRAVAAILDVRADAAGTELDARRARQSRGRPLAAIVALTALACLALWIWRSGVWRAGG